MRSVCVIITPTSWGGRFVGEREIRPKRSRLWRLRMALDCLTSKAVVSPKEVEKVRLCFYSAAGPLYRGPSLGVRPLGVKYVLEFAVSDFQEAAGVMEP
eukprot:6797522-Pyramimonas_sp.AAC.1